MARFFSLSPFMDVAAAEGYYPDQWILLLWRVTKLSPIFCAASRRLCEKKSTEL